MHSTLGINPLKRAEAGKKSVLLILLRLVKAGSNVSRGAITRTKQLWGFWCNFKADVFSKSALEPLS